MTILVLGGTAEARSLARELVGSGLPVLSSLAGRVAAPALPVGRVRIGGFGGVDGLVRTMRSEGIAAVVDATHPYATRISAHAAAAAGVTGCPLLRLQRPGWGDRPEASSWTWVPDAAAAAERVGAYQRPFLTTGRGSLHSFTALSDLAVLVRLVEEPERPLPSGWTVLISRGPYQPASERMIMVDHRVDVLVTKDSGGEHTVAKLVAAGELGVPVVIIARPPSVAGVPTVRGVAEAAAWCASVTSPARTAG